MRQFPRECREFTWLTASTQHPPEASMALQVQAGARSGCHRVRAQSFPLGVAQGRAVSETGKRETGWKAVKESQAFGCFQLPPRHVYGHEEGFFFPPSSCCPPAWAGWPWLICCQTSPLPRYGPLQAEQLCNTPCAATQPCRDSNGAGDGGTLVGLLIHTAVPKSGTQK